MPKRRQQPYDPSALVHVDLGTGAPAAVRGTILEDSVVRGQQVKRRRRMPPLDAYLLPQWLIKGAKTHAPLISKRQHLAGNLLIDAYSRCEGGYSAELTVWVDRQPDHADAAVRLAQRRDDWSKLSALIPPESSEAIRHVCCHGLYLGNYIRPPRSLDMWTPRSVMMLALLQVGLDIVANDAPRNVVERGE